MKGPVGIASYGQYVPMLRMDIGVLAEQWALGETLERVYRLNGRAMVAVNGLDEDTVTLSIEAAERAMARLPAGAARPASVLIGSESHPYAVKPSGVIVADALDLGPDVFVADLEFACKGGTAALYLSIGVVESGRLPAALAIGADCPQSAPGSLLEASVGAGASAFIVARGDGLIATIDHVGAASSDATDFWRRDGEQFPSVVGKFSAEVGYAEHTRRVVESLLAATGSKPEDFQYLCLHQPYPSLPLSVAKELGFKRPQVQPGIVAGKIGNTYSSACLLGLCNVLDQAAPGDRIMLVSFGSGAGSDGFVMTVQPAIEAYRARGAELGVPTVARWVDGAHADWLTYGQYVLTQGEAAVVKTPVAIAMANALEPGHDWRRSAGDLAIEVAASIIDACDRRAPVDALFVAAPAALLCDGQAHQGAVFADRLGLTRLPCLQLEAGDASGAAALHAAVAHVAAGFSRAALVVAVSKVSDRSERERSALLDALVDREIETPLGLGYQALCGLIADLYLQRYGLKAGDLAQVVAKNAANAVAGGETFLPHAPSAIEVRRDIPVAPPLVRSDFAPLFDTATAILVTDMALARELGGAPVEVASVASAGDVTVVADRPDMLRLEAAARASSGALARAGVRDPAALAFVEVSSACSILEVLALESAGIVAPGTTPARYKDGAGRLGSALVVNPGGGAQGRGLGLGTGGLEQAREALLQLGAGAGARQVAAAAQPGAQALALTLAGIGSHAHATVFRRIQP